MGQKHHVMRFGSIGLAVLSLVVACDSTPPPTPPNTPPAPQPDEEPTEPSGPEAIETGRDCATAEADCDAGMCTTEIKNNCEAPVTCEVLIMALCESSTSKGEARGKARGTIPAGESDKLQAVADCEGQSINATMVDSLSCK